MPCRTEYIQYLALLSMQVHASAQSKKCQKTRVRLPNLRDSAAKSLSQSNQPSAEARVGYRHAARHSSTNPAFPLPAEGKAFSRHGSRKGALRSDVQLRCRPHKCGTPYILISGRCGGGPIFEDRACYGTDKIHSAAVCPHTAHSGIFPKPLVLCWF